MNLFLYRAQTEPNQRRITCKNACTCINQCQSKSTATQFNEWIVFFVYKTSPAPLCALSLLLRHGAVIPARNYILLMVNIVRACCVVMFCFCFRIVLWSKLYSLNIYLYMHNYVLFVVCVSRFLAHCIQNGKLIYVFVFTLTTKLHITKFKSQHFVLSFCFEVFLRCTPNL